MKLLVMDHALGSRFTLAEEKEAEAMKPLHA
jgi:hypothetical protein